MNCSICFKVIDAALSCNAYPINNGRCCWQCDNHIVTPVRMARIGVPIEIAVEDSVTMQKLVAQLREHASKNS